MLLVLLSSWITMFRALATHDDVTHSQAAEPVLQLAIHQTTELVNNFMYQSDQRLTYERLRRLQNFSGGYTADAF